jgi:hypothetical protein
MSKKEEKIVRIPESKLVDVIENIVNEAISVKKAEWIAEQKNNEKAILEEKFNKLKKELGL